MPRTKELLERAKRKPQTVMFIDWTVVDRLLMDGCTGIEIAAYFGVSPDTLYLRCVKVKGVVFSQYAQQKRSKGDALIKSKQMSFAMTGDVGNATMLIWLGKNRLGQREDPITETAFNGKLSEALDKLKSIGIMPKKQEETTPKEEPKNDRQNDQTPVQD